MKRNQYIHYRLMVWGEYMRDGIVASFKRDEVVGYGLYDNARLLSVEVGSVMLSQINDTLKAVESLDKDKQRLLIRHYVKRWSISELADFEVVGRATIHNRLCAADISIQNYFDNR